MKDSKGPLRARRRRTALAPRRLGSWWRRLGSRLFGGRRGHLLDLADLIKRGDRLMAGGGQAVLIVFDFEDLVELKPLFGASLRRSVLERVGLDLQRLAGPHGLAARTGPGQFAVLLTTCTHGEAQAALKSVLGNPCRIELDASADEMILVPEVLVGECAAGPGELAWLHASLSQQLGEHQRQRHRREQYLRRSRERYSRPGGIRNANGSRPQPASDAR